MSKTTASKAPPRIKAKSSSVPGGMTPVSLRLDDCVEIFVKDILAPGKTKGVGPLMERMFKYAELRGSAPDEQGDALTINLMGFPSWDLPAYTPNFCHTLGKVVEALILSVYKEAYPDAFTQDYKDIEAQIEWVKSNLKKGEKIGKWKPDFLIGLLAGEIKYRCNNGEGSTSQSWGGQTLTKVGIVARMFFFRASPNAARYGRNSWECYEADEAFAQIKSETGIDIIKVIERAAQDPRIQAARVAGYNALMRREEKAHAYKQATYGKLFAQASSGLPLTA